MRVINAKMKGKAPKLIGRASTARNRRKSST